MSRPYIFLKTILSIIRPGSTGTRKLGSLKRQNNIYGISRGRCFGSARIVGIVGSSNTPVSGMTIAVMLLTTLILKAIGVSGTVGMVSALSVGAVVCIVMAIAGVSDKIVLPVNLGRIGGIALLAVIAAATFWFGRGDGKITVPLLCNTQKHGNLTFRYHIGKQNKKGRETK